MKLLNFGCRRSDFIISPKDWAEQKRDNPKLEWFVMCRFYEPDQPKPFIFKRKIPKALPLKDKKSSVKVLRDTMEELLDRDYNPRTQSYMFEKGGISREMYFVDALEEILKEKDISNGYRASIETYLRKVRTSAKKLNLDYVKLQDVELLHIKKILLDCAVSNSDFNKVKKGISTLFADLVDEGFLKVNPCTGIKAKQHVIAIKKVFTTEEFNEIFKYIKRTRPHFLNYFMCFTMSGSRTPEILNIQKKDVDLESREFTITVKKGSQYKREQRVIYPDALRFWTNQMNLCKSNDDYLFGKDFLPSEKPKLPNSVYSFWRVNIMRPLELDVTIYSLKHFFLDKLDEANYNAGIIAGHRNREITAIYTVGKKKRELEHLKTIDLALLN